MDIDKIEMISEQFQNIPMGMNENGLNAGKINEEERINTNLAPVQEE